ncbi:MAG: cyclic pyranopterin monophosphate synthase MoaC [Desulfurococcales archaeon]|nr:cyclic pyranopterin monophosphate synthase MoaC [Desulfurococcales archaeon]
MKKGMVDISGKESVLRIAEAEGYIRLRPDTIKLILDNKIEKGDVEEAAKIAAIQAVKKTPYILPYCHPIPIQHVDVEFNYENNRVRVRVRVKAIYKTGVEMEALTGVAAALLTIWDMVKKYEKDEKGQYPHTLIESIRVLEKVKYSREE